MIRIDEKACMNAEQKIGVSIFEIRECSIYNNGVSGCVNAELCSFLMVSMYSR